MQVHDDHLDATGLVCQCPECGGAGSLVWVSRSQTSATLECLECSNQWGIVLSTETIYDQSDLIIDGVYV